MKFKGLILSIILLGCMQSSYAVQKINAGISVDYVKDVNQSLIYASPKTVSEVPKINYSDLGYFVKFKPLNMLSSSQIPSKAEMARKTVIMNAAVSAPSVYNISINKGSLSYARTPENLEELIMQNPNKPEYLYAYAVKLTGEKRYSDAIAQIDRALKLNNNYAPGHFLKGDVLRTLGDYKNAAREYYETIRINPYCTDAYFNIAKMLEGIGNIELAISYYEMAYMVNPNDFEIRNQILKLNGRKPIKVSSL